jgi:hypothetical protein
VSNVAVLRPPASNQVCLFGGLSDLLEDDDGDDQRRRSPKAIPSGSDDERRDPSECPERGAKTETPLAPAVPGKEQRDEGKQKVERGAVDAPNEADSNPHRADDHREMPETHGFEFYR